MQQTATVTQNSKQYKQFAGQSFAFCTSPSDAIVCIIAYGTSVLY
jgi:hypothetical protein